jgi:hypothetical protein
MGYYNYYYWVSGLNNRLVSFLRDPTENVQYLFLSFSPENGNRSSFRNVVFCSEYQAMDKVQKSNNSKTGISIHTIMPCMYAGNIL